mmetsp:Transcript_33039/g.51297  ORF Transcript_33039/g.51297 Transcript_33039/m.51297 type:complete len:96 (+) Transcript_33039:443-730(+)
MHIRGSARFHRPPQTPRISAILRIFVRRAQGREVEVAHALQMNAMINLRFRIQILQPEAQFRCENRHTILLPRWTFSKNPVHQRSQSLGLKVHNG